MKTKNVKLLFYLMTIFGFIALIGAIFLGCKMNILGKSFKEIPKYKIYIFYGYGIALFVYSLFYVNFNKKYDHIISKKNPKKRK
jgi:hypothetical protein